MSDAIETYVVLAFFAGFLLYMLLVYVQTRGRPESLLSGEHRVTRFESGLDRILSVGRWPVFGAFALFALISEPAEIMRFLRDPWNPEPPFVASLLMHPGKLALIVVVVVFRGVWLAADWVGSALFG